MPPYALRAPRLQAGRVIRLALLVAELGSDAVAARCQARVDAALARYIAARGAADGSRRTA